MKKIILGLITFFFSFSSSYVSGVYSPFTNHGQYCPNAEFNSPYLTCPESPISYLPIFNLSIQLITIMVFILSLRFLWNKLKKMKIKGEEELESVNKN